MPYSKTLLTQLWPGRPGGQEPAYVQSIIAEHAFLYDELVVPTQTFENLITLSKVLPTASLRAALEGGAIRLLRVPILIAYGNNGGGLIATAFSNRPQVSPAFTRPTRDADYNILAAFGNAEDVIDVVLKNEAPHVSDRERRALGTAIMSATTDYDLDARLFEPFVAQATYEDIIGNPRIWNDIKQAFKDVGSRVQLPAIPDKNLLRHLADLDPFTKGVPGISLITEIARLNMHIGVTASLGECDMATYDGAPGILKTKLERRGLRRPNQGRFVDFLKIPGVPDIPAAVRDGRLDFRDAWDARGSSAALKFRRWLRDAAPGSSYDLARLYREALDKESIVSTWPVRLLRWAVLGAVGHYANESIGLGLACADTLFLEQWLKGYRPSLFIDELSALRVLPTM